MNELLAIISVIVGLGSVLSLIVAMVWCVAKIDAMAEKNNTLLSEVRDAVRNLELQNHKLDTRVTLIEEKCRRKSA